LVRDGDLVELNVPERRLSLLVADDELSARRRAWTAPDVQYPRGYGRLHAQHVLQADQGCDFDFLQAGGDIPEPEIH
jgi:dihydroxy-acid dehydratase